MKKIYSLIFAVLTFAANSFAQISVSGGSGLAATYTNFTLAGGLFSAINATAQTGNNIVVTVTGDITIETGAISLNAGAWTTINITPVGARTVSGSAGAAPLINFNGADNVTIDGLNSGGNSLVISNTSTAATANTSTIRYIADATSNLITNCSILGSSTTPLATNGGTIYFSTSTTTGNDNNTISNCNIGPAGANLPTKAVYAFGSTGATARNSGVIINDNNIYDFFIATASVSGIHILSGNDTWTISNNRIYQTATRTFTNTALRYAGITLNSTAGTLGSFTVSNNVIGFGAANGTGTTTINGSSNEFRGIDALSVNTTIATSIQGNIISGINQTSSRASTTTTAGCFTGIALANGTDGLFNVGGTTGNVIGSLDASSSIVITATSTTANTTGVQGILDFSLQSNTISNNQIGTITINSGGTGTTTSFRGIFVITGAGLSTTISNNTIGGTATGSITNNIVGSYSMTGILSALPNATITGNMIRNMVSNATLAAGVGTCGINAQQSTGVNTISQNTIHSLTNNAGASSNAAYALIASLSTSTSNIVERNFIHSIVVNASVTSGQVVGISCGAGSGTYKNNMIRLGIDVSGNSLTLGLLYVGIWHASSSNNNNYYHNSVYIGGSGVVSSANTYAFYSTATTITRDLRNNIFWNARSNASGGVANFAIRLGGTSTNPPGLTTNYNDLYATGVDGFTGYFNSGFRTTLADWQTATGQDANSIAYNPHFINRNGSAATVDLHIASITPTEATGTNIASVTNDFDGQTRSALTPTDIGADADNFTYGIYDEDAPVISYTLLPNTTCAAVNPVLSATITDVISGVNSTPGTNPRIYFKKSTNANVLGLTNDNTTDGWKYTEATNGTSPYSLTVDLALISGGVSVGDNIQYFVTAQDLAATPNVGINSGTFALAPASVVLTTSQFPLTGTINSFTISTGISTSVTIGAAGTYPTLTGAGGLFAAINTNGLTGNTVATIIDAAVTETGANALTPISYCAGTYTLTIKPATGVTTVLSGTNATALININGADYVTIDGSNNGTASKNMTISNTSTAAPTILLSNGAGSNIIKNCTIQGVTTGYGVITIGSTSLGGTANSDNLIQSNDITMGASRPIIGIYNIGLPGKPNSNNVISNNRLMDFSFAGYVDGNGGAAGYSNNTSVAYNEIFQTSATATTALTGINLNNNLGVVGTFIYKNNIHDLTTSSTGTIVGIDLFDATSVRVHNNMISLTNATGTLRGIAQELGVGASANIYYNTVSISGNTTTYGSFAFLKNFSSTADNIRNNIFSNTRVSATSGNQYSIYSTTAAGTFTSDYNDLYSSGNARNILGNILTIDQTTLAAWQTASAGDANSLSVAPVFTSVSDLHLVNIFNCALDGFGIPIPSYNDDYDGDVRDAAAPDMGADEFTAIYSGILAGVAGTAVCANKTVSPLGSTYGTGSCALIAYVLPSGGSAVNGRINTCVTLDATPQFFNGEPYVQRHHDIEPVTTPATATATVTLYYTDQEFVTYNTNNSGAWPLLPTSVLGNSDPARANVRITQFHGTPTGGLPTTTPGNYTGTRVLIDPVDTDVFWNGFYWAVTIPVNGFSGFYLHTTQFNTPLPITVNFLNGRKQGSNHLLDWKVTCVSTPRATMTLERSSDARNFTAMYTITADAARCAQPFEHTDVNPLKGMNYYRLKIVDADGKLTYSTTVALLNAVKGFDIISIAPNPVVSNTFKLNLASAQAGKMEFGIFDMQGRLVKRESVTVIAGFNSLPVNVANLSAGTYTIRSILTDDQSKVIRFVKQ